MNQEEKLNELQERIVQLSSDIHTSMQELRILQAEVERLKTGTGYKPGISPVAAKRSEAVTPSGNLENFIGLRLMHIVGIVVLVAGISIGVKYAIDKQMISEGLRVLLAYAAGILLFILSARLKKRYELFSAILFSGSMASTYFTTYAASVYYQFIPAPVAFFIMAGLTAYTAYMAIQYNRKEIAIIGMVGAYGIPFLISANSERMDLFFSYVLLINIGVVFISFKKSWKLMNQLALLITWILFIGWGMMRFQPAQQFIATLFMMLYFLLFLASATVLRTKNTNIFTYSDVQQVLLNNIALYIAALVVFAFSKLNIELSAITGCLFLVTALQAFLSWKMLPFAIMLQRTLTWQSLVFLLLFIGFKWDGLTVTLMWVAVSILLFVWGVWSQKTWARLASALLVGITLLKLLLFDSDRFSTIQKISSYIIIGILLLLVSFYYQKLGLSKRDSQP